MAKKPRQDRRKLVEFDAETWHGLDLLARKTMKKIWTANRLENGAARERAIVNHAGRGVPEAPSREAQIPQAAAPTSVLRALRVRAEECG
jgi:hypothetical protein